MKSKALPRFDVVPKPLSRRSVLQILSTLGFSASSACHGSSPLDAEDEPQWPQIPWEDEPPAVEPDDNANANDNIRALMDILIPVERDETGNPASPGALEVGAFEVLAIRNFIPSARAQALLPPLPDELYDQLGEFDAVFRGVLSVDLDALAATRRPFSTFRDLPRTEQEAAVRDGFEDPIYRPILSFVRAACFIAYLGAVRSDWGMQTVGYPPFEDFEGGIAVSGYPRTRDGRLVDAQSEDLAALAAAGDLDDYTYNLAPQPTVGDDLSDVLDPHGDLY